MKYVTVWNLQLFNRHYVKYANKKGFHRDRNILEQIGILVKVSNDKYIKGGGRACRTEFNNIQFNLLNTVNVRTITTQVIIIVGNVRVH